MTYPGCPTLLCTRVAWSAVACFGAGWLVWVPLALLREQAPRWSRVSASILFGVGIVLTTIGMQMVCGPCGGLP